MRIWSLLGEALTLAQICNITSDPNNVPLVVKYDVANSRGGDSTTAPLTVNSPPLSPALPTLPASVGTVTANNGSGADITGFLPANILAYTVCRCCRFGVHAFAIFIARGTM